MSTVLILRVNELDCLYRSAFNVEVVERRSPGIPHSDKPSVATVSPISKSNLNVPKRFGVKSSMPFLII